MRSRMETFEVFRRRSALAHCLSAAFTLTACAGPDAAPANSLDAASDFPICTSESDRLCVTTTCKPIQLAPAVYVDVTDAGGNGLSVGSDPWHPCAWPQPAPGPNEDLTKRGLQWNCGCGVAGWGSLDQVSDAGGCVADGGSVPDGGVGQYYETSGADPRYVLCPDTCASRFGALVRLWRACE
jgi:hypothetical protein